MIKQGQRESIAMANGLVKKLIFRMHRAGQYQMVLDLFLQHFEGRDSLAHSRTVSCAIEAAYHLGQFAECERIYSKYIERSDFTLDTLHLVLKNFLADYNFVVAKEFFRQLLQQGNGTEQTLCIFVDRVGRLARNAREVENAFWLWKDSGRKVTPTIYHAVLEQLVNLDCNDRVDQLLDLAYSQGYSELPHIYAVRLQIALQNRDNDKIDYYAQQVQESDLGSYGRNPYLLALQKFAGSEDMHGVMFVLSHMTRHNITPTLEIMNKLIYPIVLHEVSAPDYLGKLEASGHVGNQATFSMIAKVLQRKYPTKKRLIEGCLKKSQFQHGSCKKPLPASPNSPSSVLSRIIKDSKAGPTNSVDEVMNLMRRGVVPPPHLVTAVVKSLVRAGLVTEANGLIAKMSNQGYVMPVSLEIIMLRSRVAKKRQNSVDEIDRMQAVSELLQYIHSQDPAKLTLKDRSSLGREFMDFGEYQHSLDLLDSLRQGYEINHTNHDSYSLSGMIRCYRMLDDPEGVETLLSDLLESNGDIILQSRFFTELKTCEKKWPDRPQLPELRRQCREYRARVNRQLIQLLEDSSSYFKKWAEI